MNVKDRMRQSNNKENLEVSMRNKDQHDGCKLQHIS